MKTKWARAIAAGTLLSVLCAGTAFAGVWLKGQGENQDRWWYGNEDGTFANNGWYWIDGNNDGVAESYCFDSEGWLYVNTATPDGYVVNENGAWVSEGQVMTQKVDAAAASLGGVYKYYGMRFVFDDGTEDVRPQHSRGGMPEQITITVIDDSTLHLAWTKVSSLDPDGTFVLKRNGEAFVFDSYINSDLRRRDVEELHFLEGNRLEIGQYNDVIGRIVGWGIYER